MLESRMFSIITTNMENTITFKILCLFLIFSIVRASVPPHATFKYSNSGEFGEYIVEYGGNYRILSVFALPFQLGFYNTTPNKFTLALRMGTVMSTSLMRWVWEANRGKPVKENATLTFSTNGNLVLADADGTIAWQTNTANKGVVGFELLSNGNMVLHDSKGQFVWQSFDSPTDTLLVGQSLKLGGVNKLVSRLSEKVNSDGPYSLVMEDTSVSMYYYTSPNSPNKPLLYYSFREWIRVRKGPLKFLTFEDGLSMKFEGADDQDSKGSLEWRRPKYNTSLTYLRLGMDGNMKFYTYEDNSDWSAWQVTYTLMDRTSLETECQLPERCGHFGLCENDQCVACPSPNGLLGLSKDCQPPKLTSSSCGVKDFSYYKLEGVDHFTLKYTTGNGPVEQDACSSKCTTDCKSLGYFYHTKSSRCWIAYALKTLTRVANSTHLAYIKTPNK